MGNYSKFFGAIIGGLVSWGVARGVLPDAWMEQAWLDAATYLVGSLFVFFFPKNVEPTT